MSVVTPDEALAYLRIAGQSTSIDRDLLRQLVDTAEAIVTGYVGPLSSESASTAVVVGGPTFVLPASTVSAVASAVSSDGVSVASGFTVGVGGVVTNAACPRGVWSVTYTAGWAIIPAPIRTAILELTRHLHTPQRGSSGRPAEEVRAPGYLIPNRVRELLEPYVVAGFA